MKTPRSLLVILPLTAALAFTTLASAQTDTGIGPVPLVPAGPSTGGETTVRLDVGFGVRAVPPSRLTVPAGDTLRVVAPDVGTGIQYIWTKNGRAIAGASGNTLVFNRVTSADAGTYQCLFSTPTTMPAPSQTLVLGVGPTDRLLNLSTRATIGDGANQSLVSGFVVAASSGLGKKLILRAIGPSLSLFGVTNPLRQPVLRVFDANGRPYENGYVYPAVVGGPTYETDLAQSLASTGAFPIPGGTRDVVVMMPFIPGSYTVQVTSGDGTSGNVLLEVYEVP